MATNGQKFLCKGRKNETITTNNRAVQVAAASSFTA
jgi:hypothetical protein